MVKRSKNRPSGKKRHFFKIMFPGFYTKRLRIPPDFVVHISKEAYQFTTLQDSSGSHWSVKLSKTTDGTYLDDGWQDFVKDHSIYDFNFLVFGYDGNTCFNVLIFDESACKRNYVSRTKINQESAFSNGAKKCEKSSETPDSVQEAWTDQAGQCLPTFKPHGLKRGKRDDVELISEPLPRTIHSLPRRRPATEEEKAKVRKAAESFTSKFPCFSRFLSSSNAYRVFVLDIPRNFARAHLLTRQKTKVTLRSTKGEAWRVNLFNYNGRTALCGGWRAFVHANKLEEADICIFELVGKFEMQVHVFRAVKEVKFAYDDQI